MNRRNFILGLGTAATLSGAASVTGASISNQVRPAANFQVVATDRLEVEKNDALSDSTMTSNGNYSSFLNDGAGGNTSADFAPTAADDGPKAFPNMTIDNGTNSDLTMALATNTSNNSFSSFNRNGSTSAAGGPYPSFTPYSTAESNDGAGIPPLQIRNPGSAVEISTEFYLDGNRSAGDADLVTQLFNFKIVDTNNSVIDVSPDPGASTTTSNGQVVVQSGADDVVQIGGGKTDVHFELAMSDDLADQLANLASSTGALEFGTGTQTNVPLLDEVRFGVNSGNASST